MHGRCARTMHNEFSLVKRGRQCAIRTDSVLGPYEMFPDRNNYASGGTFYAGIYFQVENPRII